MKGALEMDTLLGIVLVAVALAVILYIVMGPLGFKDAMYKSASSYISRLSGVANVFG